MHLRVSFQFFFLMIRRPPRSTHCISSAASDVYKRQHNNKLRFCQIALSQDPSLLLLSYYTMNQYKKWSDKVSDQPPRTQCHLKILLFYDYCLLFQFPNAQMSSSHQKRQNCL
eukprot:TRINITY_DN13619_c0_g1_i1.p3 TRINITY_DN13619_c0_g1~~TRINITY_DN13619_c0_g1_i1.p3  ORF type:complete len:113 (-),score=14.04 TRINITY_DN13619_c0_g1_i1:300-638(-)